MSWDTGRKTKEYDVFEEFYRRIRKKTGIHGVLSLILIRVIIAPCEVQESQILNFTGLARSVVKSRGRAILKAPSFRAGE
jgi:hypothetical protein